MAIKRNALGRGLDSLISGGDIQTAGSSAINEVEISRIEPNPAQPRLTFDEDSLSELAESIRELGIVQPLTLRDNGDGTYRIIAGERRWRASKLAGLERVPAYVRSASDSELTEMALIENIQREDLNAIEIALAFRKLIDSYDLTQERLAERLGKKRATIANHLRLLRLPAEIQLGLRDRLIDMGHARALLSLEEPKQQLRIYAQIMKNGLSVRKVEEMVRRIAEGKPARETDPESERLKNIASSFEGYFPAPMKISRKKDGAGIVSFNFKNEGELQTLLEVFEKLK